MHVSEPHFLHGGADASMLFIKSGAERMKVSVIIPALNNKRTIAQVIGQAKLVKSGAEIIVICSGYYEETAEIAAKAGGCKVLTFPETLGLTAARSRGAKHAGGDILLFIDADYVIPAGQLQAFVHKIAVGWDIVLSKHFSVSFKHAETIAKHLLNHMLDKPDLKYSSLADAPFALNKRAMRIIGAELLAVPAVAHAKAILNELTVTLCDSVDMKEIYAKSGRRSSDRSQVMADHMEAMAMLVSHRGERGGYTDFDRSRHLLNFPQNVDGPAEGADSG
jgi:glycosyltransferase involved in cell wall biosynthesis